MSTFAKRAALVLFIAALSPASRAAFPTWGAALEGEDARHYYVFLYSPGPAWRAGRPITEQPLEKHFAYMGELQRRGVLVLGGPFEDGEGAMGIVAAASREEALALVSADPIVKDGVVRAEVRPWHAAAPGCAESLPFRLVPRSK